MLEIKLKLISQVRGYFQNVGAHLISTSSLQLISILICLWLLILISSIQCKIASIIQTATYMSFIEDIFKEELSQRWDLSFDVELLSITSRMFKIDDDEIQNHLAFLAAFGFLAWAALAIFFAFLAFLTLGLADAAFNVSAIVLVLVAFFLGLNPSAAVAIVWSIVEVLGFFPMIFLASLRVAAIVFVFLTIFDDGINCMLSLYLNLLQIHISATFQNKIQFLPNDIGQVMDNCINRKDIK